MKKLFQSLFLKMLAFVLVCILTPVLIGCCWFASIAYDEGMYFGEEPEFEHTSSAKRFVDVNLADVREYIYWNDISGLIKAEYRFNHKNFAYIIYDEEENIVVNTIPEDEMKNIHSPDDKGSEGYILVTEGYPADEVNEEGRPLKNYSMEGYLIMPMDPNYDGYAEFAEFEFMSENLDYFIRMGIFCFASCAVLVLYLIACSGKNSEGKIDLRGLNAMDFDILLFVAALGIWSIAEMLLNIRFAYDDIYKYIAFGLCFAGLTAITLMVIMSTAAHLKTEKWWHHTFIWQCCHFVAKFFRWFMANIGITWKLALAVGAYSFVIYILGILTTEYNFGAFALLLALFVLAAAICIAIWFGSQLRKIKRGGEAIANGDFDYRINAKELWPVLRGHAYDLNCAALGMSKAVDDRLKSERFKTELITNVSHDLKTPLTSIVSYVDLLKKEDIQSETALEYIEVIDRQSAKLKKLTEDLVEASKATSGAVAVNKEVLGIGELIMQSVGEFSEKLESAEITPVMNLPEEDITVFADGRLLWRVFDNLIQNIIKYAQPGTRAYFDISEEAGNAVLTIRNISREPLNMSAESLMERFVRGDASRGSEGNGLGLSIAKSLTELCGGTFDLMLDGDLYKVILTLPVYVQQ
ncbi:MAG: HAMP domain-containing histidine kinase [Oscillospiraceae bacterium]|nr:HAMP domain-containing histidine kinase [Oscillospiraceae bacterium]